MINISDQDSIYLPKQNVVNQHKGVSCFNGSDNYESVFSVSYCNDYLNISSHFYFYFCLTGENNISFAQGRHSISPDNAQVQILLLNRFSKLRDNMFRDVIYCYSSNNEYNLSFSNIYILQQPKLPEHTIWLE